MVLPVAILSALDWEERAVRAALAATRALPTVRCIVVVGCAGGLQPTIHSGDLVVAAAVGLVDPDGEVQAHWPAADAGVAVAATRHGVRVQVGPIVSSPVALGAERKRAVATSGALSVDMESAAIMGVALQRHVPFVAIRVVLDEVADELPPDLDVLGADGSIRLGAAVRAAFRHPQTLWRLAQQRTLCERRLATALPLLLRADALGLPPMEQQAAG